MVYRALMVLKMDPRDAQGVADAFAEHDTTGLPQKIGVQRRTLFRFHDLYMHLIEAENDIMPRLYEHREHPDFVSVNQAVSRRLVPYSSDWTEISDSKAEVFYSWQADGEQ